ncbi:hypothetical protein [Pseudomonas sp. RA_15y_Pfl2_54]|uniref:hypothetical protein n=1 Tax=Pseudomonas sp. RA_15y_Pfl2_54 TaxID=3088704 RepID=UPI0030DCE668
MKYLYPAPLFGQATSFLCAHASENPEERSLISDFLCSTRIVGAVESHQLVCDYLKLIANTRRGALKDYKSVIEKLLLWCFLVKRKSLLDIESGELLIFLDFFESPPESWIAPIGKRFLHSREGTTNNDSWRPFRCQQNDSVWCCPLINHFFSINKVFFGRTVRIPRHARVRAQQAPVDPGKIEAAAAKYLEIISGSTSPRGRHEKQLFVFVCAYYLQISLPAFANLSDYLHMENFKYLPEGRFEILAKSPQFEVRRVLPEEFNHYFSRYKTHLGLSPALDAQEKGPLFPSKGWDAQANRDTVYDWGARLPRVKALGISAPKLLQQLSKRCSDLEEDIDLYPKDTGLDKSSLYYEKIQHAIRSFDQEQNLIGAELESQKGIFVPLPLFRYPVDASRIAWYVDFDNLFKLLGSKSDLVVCDEYLSELIKFIRFLSGVGSRGSLLKSIAYEKFLLWSLLVRDSPPSQLLEEDAIAFYNFCSRPPESWVCNRRVRRFIKTDDPSVLISNPEWKPFFIESNSDHANFSMRAARIIQCCESAQDWLLLNGLVRTNIFHTLSCKLWGTGSRPTADRL